jgi:Flp pilus assembly protein TadG
MLPRGFLRSDGGTAAMEMALILPGIAFILLNVVDLSSYIYTKMQVDLAAHEAVGSARVLCDTSAKLPATINCGTTLNSTMLAAARTTTLGNSINLTSGSTIEKYYCANATGALVEVAAANGTPPANCSSTVSGSTSAPGIYIQVTASFAYAPIFPGASIGSTLPTPITRTAWMRLK